MSTLPLNYMENLKPEASLPILDNQHDIIHEGVILRSGPITLEISQTNPWGQILTSPCLRNLCFTWGSLAILHNGGG